MLWVRLLQRPMGARLGGPRPSMESLWAVQMVVRHVVPGAAQLLCDCQAVQWDCGRGIKWATAPGRVLARVWAVVAAPCGGATPNVVWMPAHTAEHDVGVLL